jgi:hypothetical protein
MSVGSELPKSSTVYRSNNAQVNIPLPVELISSTSRNSDLPVELCKTPSPLRSINRRKKTARTTKRINKTNRKKLREYKTFI